MAAEHRPHTVSFRVTKEEWEQIEARAQMEKVSPHDLARDMILEELKDTNGMTPGQRVIFEEVARIRYMLSCGFQLHTTGQFTPESWEQTKRVANERAEDIVKNLVRRHYSNGHTNGHAKGGVES